MTSFNTFRIAVTRAGGVRYSLTTTLCNTFSCSSVAPSATAAGSFRSYVSRAHPTVKPVFAVNEALDDVLQDIENRNHRRQRRWERNAKTPEERKENKHMDETIELAINLNVDPRKPGQSLRGSIALPNGTGNTFSCVVFTDDDDLAEAALQAGAKHAGGTAVMDAILSGEIPVNGLDRSLATSSIMAPLSKKLARLLGPRGLMPNAKTGTLVEPSDVLATLETQVMGRDVQYRTEREGVVHVPVGKSSFGAEKLLENIGAVMKEIFAVKPEQYGKGKKNNKSVGKGTKYLLKAFISSTQGRSIGLETRTVDPNSPFFLTSVETGPGAGTSRSDVQQAA